MPQEPDLGLCVRDNDVSAIKDWLAGEPGRPASEQAIGSLGFAIHHAKPGCNKLSVVRAFLDGGVDPESIADINLQGAAVDVVALVEQYRAMMIRSQTQAEALTPMALS